MGERTAKQMIAAMTPLDTDGVIAIGDLATGRIDRAPLYLIDRLTKRGKWDKRGGHTLPYRPILVTVKRGRYRMSILAREIYGILRKTAHQGGQKDG